MEKSKSHHFLFTVAMAFIMVYAMICYNISLNIGGMTNAVFVMAFHELWLETTVLNFPMALAWQIFYGGAAIRQLEKKYIKHFTTNKN